MCLLRRKADELSLPAQLLPPSAAQNNGENHRAVLSLHLRNFSFFTPRHSLLRIIVKISDFYNLLVTTDFSLRTLKGAATVSSMGYTYINGAVYNLTKQDGERSYPADRREPGKLVSRRGVPGAISLPDHTLQPGDREG